MKPLTLFSWGYYGWGNYTKQLVEAADAVEAKRGFNPPVFVDVRISRMVRAPGFREKAFEKLLGPDRYRWMKSLGNMAIEDASIEQMQIAEPQAAGELLELAIHEEKANHRRVIFFCSCQYPCIEGDNACHRVEVGSLLLKEAKKRKVKVEVIEWPGGEPRHIDMVLSAREFKAVAACRQTLQLAEYPEIAELAGLPWMSSASFRCGEEEIYRLVGPACYGAKGWVLPITVGSKKEQPLSEYQEVVKKFRKLFGYNALKK